MVGGVWLNLGPLLWHFADQLVEKSIELSWVCAPCAGQGPCRGVGCVQAVSCRGWGPPAFVGDCLLVV